MAPQITHWILAEMAGWVTLGAHSSSYVCRWLCSTERLASGVEVPPTKCSNLGDVCSSLLTGVAPFKLGMRQRRSSARIRVQPHFVNIMFIMRIRKSAFLLYKYGVLACVTNARPFYPGAKHKMLCREPAMTPPARLCIGVGLVQPHTHFPTEFCPPAPPLSIITLTGEKLWQADPNARRPLRRLRSEAARSICRSFYFLAGLCLAWR